MKELYILKGGNVMSLMKKILDWNEEKFEEIDENTKHPGLKAFGCGAINGFIDSSVIWFIPVLLSAYYWKHKANEK